MTVKKLIEILEGAPQDYEVGSGGVEMGSASVKYVDIDGVAGTVTLWNVTSAEVEEFFTEELPRR